jgi:hypothetical protein
MNLMPDDAGLPRILYKYCPGTALEILKKRELKVTIPKEFNDPFEFSPVVSGTITLEDIQLALDDPSWKPGEMLAQKIGRLDHRALPTNQRLMFYENLAQQFNKAAAVNIRDHCLWVSKSFGVVCLSSDPASVLMWSHYADKHRGFVVGVDHQKIGELAIRKVIYKPERVVIPAKWYLWADRSPMVAEKIFTHKSPEWRYEQEYRILFDLKEAYLRDAVVNDPPFKVLPLGDSISEIWLGVRADGSLEDDIRAIAPLGVTPRRFNLHPEAYELTR